MEKEVIFAPIPSFNQENQYVVQLPPIEDATSVYYGVEVQNIAQEEVEDFSI